MEWVKLILTFLGGTFITALFAYIINRRKENRGDFDSISNHYEKLLERYEKEIGAFEFEVADLRERVRKAETQIILLESASNYLPLPMWLKDMEFRMLYVNKEYERLFLAPKGKTAADYFGKFDTDIWGEEIARKYRENDIKALTNTSKSWTGEEIALEGQRIKVFKYVRFMGRNPIGIAGVAIPFGMIKEE